MRILILILLTTVVASAQTVDEWKKVNSGRYTGNHILKNLHVNKIGFITAISSSLGSDSVNTVQCSNDGGNTWYDILKTVCNPYNLPVAVQDTLWWQSQFLQSVVSASKDTVIVLLGRRPKDDNDIEGIYGTIYPEILRTTDGGISWKGISITPGKKTNPHFQNEMVMDDKEVAYVLSADAEDEFTTRIYRTTDAGASWHTTNHSGWRESSRGDVKNLFVNGANKVVLQFQDSVYISNDSGNTFLAQNLYRKNGTLFSAKHSTLIATTASTIKPGYVDLVISKDEGKTWNLKENLPYGLGDVISMDVNSNGEILVLYKSGVGISSDEMVMQNFTPFTIMNEKSTAKSVRWIDNVHALATAAGTMYLKTGKQVPKQPRLSSVRTKDTLRTHFWEKQAGIEKYQLQIAHKKSGSTPELLPDYTIFDKTGSQLLDTVVGTTSIEFTYTRGYDVYARVRSLSTTDSSAWSEQHIFRIPLAPPIKKLREPILEEPEKGSVLATSKVHFVWWGDDRTTSWDLLITDREPSIWEWADSISYNQRNLTSTNVYVNLPVGKKYYWYVIGYSEEFEAVGSNRYQEFYINPTSIHTEILTKTIESVRIVDVQGKQAQTQSLDNLPSGIWMITTCYTDGTCNTEKVLR